MSGSASGRAAAGGLLRRDVATIGLAFVLENARPRIRDKIAGRARCDLRAGERSAGVAPSVQWNARRSREELLPSLLIAGPLMLLTAAVVSGASVRPAVAVLVVGTTLAMARPLAIGWPRLLAGLILVILFIPIRRYSLPANLPFQLESYRLFVAALVLGWMGSLLVDRRVRLRRTGFEGPLAVILGVAIASIIVNPGRVAETSAEVNKSLMFLFSFVVVLYLTVSGIRRLSDVDFLAR